MNRFVAVAAAAAVAAGAQAQYSTDFEGLMASAAGELLTGQDSYYNPVAGSNDFRAFTYAGSPYSIPANPEGGAQFVAGEGLASPGLARAQRDITWPGGLVEVTFDFAGAYIGGGTPANNLGSFSQQPSTTAANSIFLFSWTDTAAQTWQLSYNAFDAAGVAKSVSLGTEWTGLPLLTWFRITTVIDFTTNQLVCGTIVNLDTGDCATATFTDSYLFGGAAGAPLPTGFRFFAGAATAGNVTAWDNLSIDTAASASCPACPDECYADCDDSGTLDFFDFLCFQNAFATMDPYADCDDSGALDFFDFLCFQNEFGMGCP